MTHTLNFFLSVVLTGCVCGLNPSVWQTPRIITAESGERVNISCNFTLRTSQRGRWRVAWRKNNDTVFLNEIYNISDIKPNILTGVSKSHTLTFPSVDESHSGIYYCTVWQDVPQLGPKTEGGGTQLIVNSTVRNITIISKDTTADQSVTSVMLVMWAAPLALALIIGCFTSVTCCFYRGCCMEPKLKREYQELNAESATVTEVVYSCT
ncbi:uncharacterized protein si:dkey-63d15.12 [Pangasianodon hypophthalmus]|uniref:uncharacterized protein si:dkey-63d15.12 n=1 Tax=Pangasianodon hypophthalmus TaxID=310915 RepID=UPI00230752E3|nr:uncharacterized protein si:dkey-63d15.12 [Pangasianodon hypophthalmus]